MRLLVFLGLSEFLEYPETLNKISIISVGGRISGLLRVMISVAEPINFMRLRLRMKILLRLRLRMLRLRLLPYYIVRQHF
jgi:hypothetical protein